MKNYEYTVFFASGSPITVYCGSEAEARILAQAERIKAGLEYRNVEGIVKDEG